VVYDHGPVPGLEWDDFDAVRARLAAEWEALPRAADNISASLRSKMAAEAKRLHKEGVA
jgi:nicotinamide phosphoribosyltransferase